MFPVGYIVPDVWPMPAYFVCLDLDGSRLWRVDWPELFDVIGTNWGGERTPVHFNLPDVRVRVGDGRKWNFPNEICGYKIVARILSPGEPIAA